MTVTTQSLIRPGMKAMLGAERQKIRRRNIWLTVLALITAQLLWALWALRKWSEGDFSQGWRYFLYQFPALNSIMLPVVAAVVASRLSDAEHKGSAWKLLKTMQRGGMLFDCKFVLGMMYVGAVAALQILVIVMLGTVFRFGGGIPWVHLVFYGLATFVVTGVIYLLQQVLSMVFQNQVIAVTVGLAGGFTGLLSLFLPPAVGRLILWGYYGVLSTVEMLWNRDTAELAFYWTEPRWANLLLFLTVGAALYAAGRTCFARKEL